MLNERSMKALQFVHRDLVSVVLKADELTELPFIITEGLRTLERQKILFAKGLSKTMKSRHLPHPTDGLSRAIDFAPIVEGEVSWKTPAFVPIIAAFFKASAALNIPIESGSKWRTFKDYPHIQLPWREYP